MAGISALAVGAGGGRRDDVGPELHRYLVAEHGWISEVQFGAAITLAQAAPGPNVLFIAVLGWQVGWSSVPATAGPVLQSSLAALGLLVALLGVMAPSTALTYGASRWVQRHRERLVCPSLPKRHGPHRGGCDALHRLAGGPKCRHLGRAPNWRPWPPSAYCWCGARKSLAVAVGRGGLGGRDGVGVRASVP